MVVVDKHLPEALNHYIKMAVYAAWIVDILILCHTHQDVLYTIEKIEEKYANFKVRTNPQTCEVFVGNIRFFIRSGATSDELWRKICGFNVSGIITTFPTCERFESLLRCRVRSIFKHPQGMVDLFLNTKID